MPFVQQMVRVDLRTLVLDVPSQDVISRDNVSVKVNAVLYYRVIDPERAIIQVENYDLATSQLAQTTLRSVLGKHELDEMLAERDKLNADIGAVSAAEEARLGDAEDDAEDRRVDRAVEGPEEARLELRRPDHDVRVHAERRDRQRPPGGVFLPRGSRAGAARVQSTTSLTYRIYDGPRIPSLAYARAFAAVLWLSVRAAFRYATYALAAGLLVVPARAAAQGEPRCVFLCAPELKVEPTWTVENLAARPRISAGGLVERARRETVFETDLRRGHPDDAATHRHDVRGQLRSVPRAGTKSSSKRS